MHVESRQHLRVKCGFVVRHGGSLVPTFGDVSPGGAKFTVDSALGAEVEVLAGDIAAKARVLQVLEGGGQFTYRVQFVDAAQGTAVFEAAQV